MRASSFDKAAPMYDMDFTYTRIGKIQRDRVWKYLKKLVKTKDISSVLELNCGTGEDAKFLADLGCSILATDVSEDMLNIASKKTEHKNVTVSKLDLSNPNIDTNGTFDLVFSNFGGLNCIDQSSLVQLNDWLYDKINPGAHLLFVLMPSMTIIDRWYKTAKGLGRQIKERKLFKKLDVSVKGQLVTTYYHNPEDIITAFNKFTHVSSRSIGFIPSYLERNQFLKLLLVLDKLLNWSNLDSIKADHYLIHLTKN